MKKQLNSDVFIEHTDSYVHLSFAQNHKVLSSAILNGGVTTAKHILNKRVPKQGEYAESPRASLLNYVKQQAWDGGCIGMMTAASMESLRVASESEQGIELSVLVTAGLSNARRIGDYAEYRNMLSSPQEVGTINLIVVTSAVMTDAALAEAAMIATEAKVAALYDAGVKSPISQKVATGTGTDTVAIACCVGQENIQYCGKHVLFGEMLGRLAYQAVMSSISWDVENIS